MNDGITRSVTLPPRRPRTPALNAATVRDVTSTTKDVPPPRPIEPDDPRLAEISPAAKAIAIAHLVDQWLRDGTVKNMTEAARKLAITPSRMQQLDQLLTLSPTVQEAVLLGETSPSVRDLQWAARAEAWSEHGRWPESRSTGVQLPRYTVARDFLRPM